MPTAPCKAARIGLLLLVACAFACADDGESGSPVAAPGPCDGVWSSAYRTCLEEWSRTCVGLQCLIASPCGGQADLALAECCAEFYAATDEFDACLERR